MPSTVDWGSVLVIRVALGPCLSSACRVAHNVVIGQQELDDNFRELKAQAKKLAKEDQGKPFIPREWPAELSKQAA